MTTARIIVARLLILTMGLVTTALLLEGGLRVAGLRPVQEATHLFTHDELLGWRFRPGARGVHSALGFATTYAINSKGLRDREIPYEKAPGTYRIVVLGDSFTEGFGVPADRAYARQLELVLNRTGARVEVVNAGIRGYGTDQEFLWLAHEGLKYRPDLVIVGFYDGDEDSTSQGVVMGNGARRYRKPYFVMDGGRISLRGVPVPPVEAAIRADRLDALKGVLRRSVLYAWVQWHVYAGGWAHLLRRVGMVKTGQPVGPPGAASPAGDAWITEEALLVTMQGLVRRQGGDLMVALIGGNPVYAGRLAAICARHGMAFVDVEQLDSFRSGRTSAPVVIPYDGHWNVLGHRLAAEGIAAVVARRYLRSPDPGPGPGATDSPSARGRERSEPGPGPGRTDARRP